MLTWYENNGMLVFGWHVLGIGSTFSKNESPQVFYQSGFWILFLTKLFRDFFTDVLLAHFAQLFSFRGFCFDDIHTLENKPDPTLICPPNIILILFLEVVSL